MPHSLQTAFAGVAIGLTLVGFYPYIMGILRGTVRPHLFTWIIWSIATVVVFMAQISDHGGMGAWPIGLSGVITVGVTVLAYIRRADTTITATDWGFLLAAMAAIGLWFVTDSPLWTVVLLTTVDTLGFGPTVGKAWRAPHSESLTFFGIFAIRNVFSMLALENMSVITLLFPGCMTVACGLLMLLIVVRRQSVEMPNPAR